MGEVKWIKITTDMFDNRKIKHLRKLPEGNSIVLIWVMLLTLAGRCNANGIIFLTENIPYTTKMLADELDFEESTVQLALKALEQFGMIQTGDTGFLAITGWEEHQNIDGMEKIREQNRIRKQNQRQRALAESTSRDVSRDSNVTVTQCHATDKELDKDIDTEKEVDIEKDIDCTNLIDSTSQEDKRENRVIPPFVFPPTVTSILDEAQLSESIREAALEWIRYKKERKEGYRETGLRTLLNEIKKYEARYGAEAVIGIIQKSMSSNYAGIVFDRLDKNKPTEKPDRLSWIWEVNLDDE